MRVVIACAAAATLAACGHTAADQVPTPTDVGCVLSSIHISPAYASVHPGDSLQVSAIVEQCQGYPSSTAVRWRASDTSLAVVDPVSGLVRARASGSVTIVASLMVDTTIGGAMVLVVVPR